MFRWKELYWVIMELLLQGNLVGNLKLTKLDLTEIMGI
ncbi:Uncharacterised protein [Yersinia enterocolitica]|nr:Uncharacterised protein [Yersinia enterocolitica]